MLERMENMAGRIVANELMAVSETDGYGALDEIGRERLRKICREFHQTCARVKKDIEIENLHWRVQAIASGQDYGTDPSVTNQMDENPPVAKQIDEDSRP